MKAGDALYKFFTEVVGIKPEDADLKAFLSDAELAKTEITKVSDFSEHFMTFEQAKKNKAITQSIFDDAKNNAYGEFIGHSEGSLRKWAKAKGVEAEKINEIFRAHTLMDAKISAVLDFIGAHLEKTSGQTASEWKEERIKLNAQLNDANNKLEEETKRITGEFTQKLTAKEKEFTKMTLMNDLPSIMKFKQTPGLAEVQEARLEKGIFSKYHVVKENNDYKFFELNDHSKEVFINGKTLTLNKLVGDLFPIAEFGDNGKTKTNGEGKTKTTVLGKEENAEVSKEMQEKLEALEKNAPRKFVPQE